MHRQHRQKILAFLQSQKLAVVSTSALAHVSPESALIAFAEDNNLCVYFQTGVHTRKANNLRLNPHLSLVFGLSLQDLITVQYEGTAEQLTSNEALAACKQLFYS